MKTQWKIEFRINGQVDPRIFKKLTVYASTEEEALLFKRAEIEKFKKWVCKCDKDIKPETITALAVKQRIEVE